MNDLLHHTKFHSEAGIVHIAFASTIEPYLDSLFRAVATHSPKAFAKYHQKITELLDNWDSCAYFDNQVIGKLRSVVADPSKATAPTLDGIPGDEAAQAGSDSSPVSKETPFTLPQFHGESSTPYYDLPTGNLLPHVKPNSSSSIDPRLVRPLQLNAGPANEQLTVAVKAFLEDVQALYCKVDDFDREDSLVEFDELGQSLLRDETGEIVAGESYYGWSKAFCTQMKERHSGRGPTIRDIQDYGRERNGSPWRRQRSSSLESSASQFQKRSRSSSRRGFARVGHRRGRSPSDDYALMQQRHHKPFHRRSLSQSSSRSYSPPQAPSFSSRRTPDASNGGYEQNRPVPTQQVRPPLPQGLVFGPGTIPIPPPPAGYTGPWPPPPPPPLLGQNNGLSVHSNSFPAFPPFLPPSNRQLSNSATPFDPQYNLGFTSSGRAQQHSDFTGDHPRGRLAQDRGRGVGNH